MENKKIAAIIVLMIFALSLTPKAYAQESSDIRACYHYDEWGLTIRVKAPANTEPEQKINVSVSVCHVQNLSITYLSVTVYDFKSGEEKNQIGTIKHVERGIGYDLQSNGTYARTYEIEISENVWDITYGEISCEWEFGGHTFYIHDDGFVMTYVKNVEMEELIEQLANKTEQLANKTQECDTLWQNYTQLNQTYWDLKGNQTSGIEVDLSNTRVVMAVFIITTVFFVATTLYLTLKKPREYW